MMGARMSGGWVKNHSMLRSAISNTTSFGWYCSSAKSSMIGNDLLKTASPNAEAKNGKSALPNESRYMNKVPCALSLLVLISGSSTEEVSVA